jgi:hypothetical protein
MTGEVFVNGIVEHLGNAMMEGALVRAADIHARLFANGFETFKLAEF